MASNRVEVPEDLQQIGNELDDRVEKYVAALLAYYASLLVAIRLASSEAVAEVAIQNFLSAVATINSDAIWDTARWSVARTGQGDLLGPLTQSGLRTDTVARMAARMVQDGRRRAAQRVEVSGRDYLQELGDNLITKSEANRLKKELDAEITQAASMAVWNEGRGIMRYKLVVGVVDKDQTALCRRLHGTIWEWGDPIIDPVSGGQRMFPPFIGPDFDPQYHHCRSVIVPYTRSV